MKLKFCDTIDLLSIYFSFMSSIFCCLTHWPWLTWCPDWTGKWRWLIFCLLTNVCVVYYFGEIWPQIIANLAPSAICLWSLNFVFKTNFKSKRSASWKTAATLLDKFQTLLECFLCLYYNLWTQFKSLEFKLGPPK